MSGLLRRKNTVLQEKLDWQLDIANAIAATVTFPLGTTETDFYIEKFEVTAFGGFVGDPANYWVITLQDGATVLATYSTLSTAQGTLTAGAMGAGSLGTTISGAKGDTLSIVLTKNGNALNFPAQSRIRAAGHQL